VENSRLGCVRTLITMDVWEQIKRRLAETLTEESFNNWFTGTRSVQLEGDRLRVAVPSEIAAEFIQQEYNGLIRRVISELKLPVTHVEFEVLSDGRSDHEAPDGDGQACPPIPSLNPRLTFETFVVGSCNQLAHAAARAIVEAPARVYNPVLVYGGPGTGKTHLLHAIGWELHRRYPTARVVLTSGERFLRDLVRSIRQQRMGSFYQLYRSADVLLVDGIHTVAGKESTQEELLHTLNDLHDRDRQVVLSSDCPPKDIPGLSHRLRLRLESGLMAQIQPPDLETKLAILERKAEQERIALPDKVKIFLASKAYLSVREFEAVLYQLRAVSSVMGTPITIHLAQQVLRDLTPNRERRVTTDSIMRAVAAHFDLQPAQLKARCNAPRIAVPRQIAMYLTRELTGASLPEIARAFGGKHHTTVLHSIRKIERLRQQDQDLNNLIHKLIEALQ